MNRAEIEALLEDTTEGYWYVIDEIVKRVDMRLFGISSKTYDESGSTTDWVCDDLHPCDKEDALLMARAPDLAREVLRLLDENEARKAVGSATFSAVPDPASPLPWREIVTGGPVDRIRCVDGSNGSTVCEVGEESCDEASADAAYIIQTANGYPALLLAHNELWSTVDGLREQLAMVRHGSEIARQCDQFDEYQERAETAEAEVVRLKDLVETARLAVVEATAYGTDADSEVTSLRNLVRRMTVALFAGWHPYYPKTKALLAEAAEASK